ncbi:MAG: sugar-transfer associated ATP-grasp domain-containing protein [Acetanaerobacterium sp.]
MLHKLQYLLNTVRSMDRKAMVAKARVVHRRTGKPTPAILADMVRCASRYGAGYMDYTVLEFYRLAPAERDTFLTRGRSNELVRALNNREYWHCFEDKTEFLTRFAQYLGRQWIDLNNTDWGAFAIFCEGKDRIIVKPVDGDGGKGVDCIVLDAHPDRAALYDTLKQNGQTLCEEYVVQHPVLAAIYPGSVNTLRIVTVVNETGGVDITRCLIRIGAGGVVDNISSGGMAALIDPQTGEIIRPAHDKNGDSHTVHPLTGAPIVGVVVPMFNRVLAMVRTAAREVPEIRYCAWDIAVCEAGPVFIEGNQYPGHEIQQLPPHLVNNTGMWPVYKKYLGRS